MEQLTAAAADLSIAEIAHEWIGLHPIVDRMLGIAAVSALVFVALIAAVSAIYCLCWGLRLLTYGNVKKFVTSPIPMLQKAKFAGGEFEVTEFVEVEEDAEGDTAQAIEDLDRRLKIVEQLTSKPPTRPLASQ